MGVPAAIQGIGAGVQAGQAINSGVKGARAQNQLTADTNAQRDVLNGVMTTGQEYLDQVGTGYQQFNNPNLGDQVLGMGQGAAAGVAGVNNAVADALGNQGIAGDALSLLQGGYQNNVGIPQAGGQMSFNQPGMDQFNFQAPQQLASQFTQNALDAGNRARVGAQEQLGAQFQQANEGLNSALAERGLSPNSGAALAALGGNTRAATGQMANFERGLADMQGNAALQGAQLDAQNLMGFTGMGSQYNLGMNQLGQQSALGAFNANLGAQGQNFGQQMQGAQLQAGIDQAGANFNLGAAGQMAGLQGMQNDVTMQQGAMRNAAYTQPLDIMNGIYQQNFLNPQLQGLGQMGNIAQSLLGQGIGGLDQLLGRQAEGVSAAGSGKGAATGGAIGGAQNAYDARSPKGAGAGAGYKPGGGNAGGAVHS